MLKGSPYDRPNLSFSFFVLRYYLTKRPVITSAIIDKTIKMINVRPVKQVVLAMKPALLHTRLKHYPRRHSVPSEQGRVSHFYILAMGFVSQ